MTKITCPECKEKHELPIKKCPTCGFVFKFQQLAPIESIRTPEEQENKVVEQPKPKKAKKIKVEKTEKEIMQEKRLCFALLFGFLIFGIIKIATTSSTLLINYLYFNVFKLYINSSYTTDVFGIITFIEYSWYILILLFTISNKRGLRFTAIILSILSIVIETVIFALILINTLKPSIGCLLLVLVLIIWTSYQIMTLGKKEQK